MTGRTESAIAYRWLREELRRLANEHRELAEHIERAVNDAAATTSTRASSLVSAIMHRVHQVHNGSALWSLAKHAADVDVYRAREIGREPNPAELPEWERELLEHAGAKDDRKYVPLDLSTAESDRHLYRCARCDEFAWDASKGVCENEACQVKEWGVPADD